MDPVLRQNIECYVQYKIQSNKKVYDYDYDYDYVNRLRNMALRLSYEENVKDIITVEAAALLCSVTKEQKLEDVKKEAWVLLTPYISTYRIYKIMYILDKFQNWSNCTQMIELVIVRDANFLISSGAVGIAQIFLHGGAMGFSMEDVIQKFNSKLFKIQDQVQTTCAKRIAAQKHKVVEDFFNVLIKDV